jgi:hypothetical protein
MHIDDNILDAAGKIDPNKIDLVARMGADYYCRASGAAVFEVPKPNAALGIGIDALPEHVRMSKVLTGNHLGILGNCTAIPQRDDLNDKRVKGLLDLYKSDVVARNEGLHRYAKTLIEAGDIDKAWQALLVCTS